MRVVQIELGIGLIFIILGLLSLLIYYKTDTNINFEAGMICLAGGIVFILISCFDFYQESRPIKEEIIYLEKIPQTDSYYKETIGEKTIDIAYCVDNIVKHLEVDKNIYKTVYDNIEKPYIKIETRCYDTTQVTLYITLEKENDANSNFTNVLDSVH